MENIFLDFKINVHSKNKNEIKNIKKEEKKTDPMSPRKKETTTVGCVNKKWSKPK